MASRAAEIEEHERREQPVGEMRCRTRERPVVDQRDEEKMGVAGTEPDVEVGEPRQRGVLRA